MRNEPGRSTRPSQVIAAWWLGLHATLLVAAVAVELNLGIAGHQVEPLRVNKGHEMIRLDAGLAVALGGSGEGAKSVLLGFEVAEHRLQGETAASHASVLSVAHVGDLIEHKTSCRPLLASAREQLLGSDGDAAVKLGDVEVGRDSRWRLRGSVSRGS